MTDENLINEVQAKLEKYQNTLKKLKTIQDNRNKILKMNENLAKVKNAFDALDDI